MPNLRSRVNQVLSEYLYLAFVAFLVILGSATTFYWSTQSGVINQASAADERSRANQDLGAEIRGKLDDIQTDVSEIKTDLAVVKDRSERLEQ